MASGPLAPRVIGSLAPSVRDVVLAPAGYQRRTRTWRSMSFAGLRFAVPPRWPVARTAYAFGCDPPDIAFSPPSVTLDTDTNLARLPCPYPRPGPPRDKRRPDRRGQCRRLPTRPPADGLRIVVNGLQMYLDAGLPLQRPRLGCRTARALHAGQGDNWAWDGEHGWGRVGFYHGVGPHHCANDRIGHRRGPSRLSR